MRHSSIERFSFSELLPIAILEIPQGIQALSEIMAGLQDQIFEGKPCLLLLFLTEGSYSAMN